MSRGNEMSSSPPTSFPSFSCPGSAPSLDKGQTRSYVKYPPQVVHSETLGYVFDNNKRGYSRDIGRSSRLGGRIYFSFGDTFCKDSAGQFVGIANQTIALAINAARNPTETEYQRIEEDGMVVPLVPFTEEEVEFNRAHHADNGGDGGRITLWMFGGVVEEQLGCGYGHVFYEKGEQYSDHSVAHGVGVARVATHPSYRQAYAIRLHDTLFAAGEPRWGSFSAMTRDGHYHLWGHHDGKILLAKVPVAEVENRAAYEFWNGEAYVADWGWAVPVMAQMQHGAVWESRLFGPGRGHDFVFVGVSSAGDSKVRMGTAPRLEGPWKFSDVFEALGKDYPDGYMYCMYPHPWAFREEEGELMVSWSEHWPGGVVAAKLVFAMDDPWHFEIVPIGHLGREVQERLVGAEEERGRITAASGSIIVVQGRLVYHGMATPLGEAPLHFRVEGPTSEGVAEAVMLLGRVRGRIVAEESERKDEETEAKAAVSRRKGGRWQRVASLLRRSSDVVPAEE
ncbi:MAG: hypothetical protein M1827_003860 [Pycnora praestabilis]|nr:MAG: hypothetical protein M1827_003860 [Pycnora praestabilis]